MSEQIKEANLGKENNDDEDNSDSEDEKKKKFLKVKENFLSSLDRIFNRDKEKMKQIVPIFETVDKIFKKSKEINVDIKNLEQSTQTILEKQHKDYINTFVSFMDSIRKDLTSKLEEMEKIAEEQKKSNDIRVIKAERDFFRLFIFLKLIIL